MPNPSPNSTAGIRKSHKVMPAALPPMALQHHIQYFWVKNVSLYDRKGCISHGPQQCWDIKSHQEYLQSFKQILLAPQVSSRELRNIEYRTTAGIMSLICWQRLDFAKPLAKDVAGCASENSCWDEEQGQGWKVQSCGISVVVQHFSQLIYVKLKACVGPKVLWPHLQVNKCWYLTKERERHSEMEETTS